MSDMISKQEATTIPVMPKEHREYQTMNLDDAYEQGWFDCQKCIEDLPSAEPKTPSNGSITCVKSEKMHVRPTGDLISRQDAIEAVLNICNTHCNEYFANAIKELPSAEPERDIPIKPIETTDRAWGIPNKQAVCPKCDYYLGHVAFLGDYKGKRITYCETCGQAIDWEGWEFDE